MITGLQPPEHWAKINPLFLPSYQSSLLTSLILSQRQEVTNTLPALGWINSSAYSTQTSSWVRVTMGIKWHSWWWKSITIMATSIPLVTKRDPTLLVPCFLFILFSVSWSLPGWTCDSIGSCQALLPGYSVTRSVFPKGWVPQRAGSELLIASQTSLVLHEHLLSCLKRERETE